MGVIIRGPWKEKDCSLKPDELRNQVHLLEDAVGVVTVRLKRLKVLLGMEDEDWRDEIPD